jgi:Arc/MetJ family transcription regulator
LVLRTTVTIPDEVLEDLMRFSGAKTRTAAVNHAVVEWVRRQKIEELRALRGKVEFDGPLEDLRRAEIEELKELDSYGTG